MKKKDVDIYKYKNTFTKSEKFKRLLWDIVYIVFFRITPRWCLNRWRVFLLRVFGASIGLGSKVYPTCKVWAPWNLEMGSFSTLGGNVDCYSMDKVVIGSKVTISQKVYLCTGSHDIKYRNLPLKTKPIYIKDFVWVCANSYIGPGVSIDTGAVVAACSVVVKDVDTFDIVAGNPASVIKKRVLIKN